MKSKAGDSASGSKAQLSKLSSQTLSAMFWMFSGHGFRVALRMIIFFVLARLVTPAEFGLVAAAFAIIGFSEIVGRLGVGPALVQRKELEERHVYTGFNFSILFSLVLATLLWLVAPLIGDFYQDEQVVTILRVIILVVPLNSLAVVGDSLLQRELRFRRLMGIELTALIVGSGLVGIGTALLGWGVWALVAMHVTRGIVKTIGILIGQPHSKRLRFDIPALKELLSFGGGLTLARIFNRSALQGDNLVVGRWLGMDALGLYSRAYNLMTTTISLLAQAVQKVLFSSMAKVQNKPERLAVAYRRGVALIGLVLLPISVAAWVLAPEVIDVALGPAWTGTITPFRILVLGSVFRASYKVSAALAGAKGAVYRSAWRQAIYATLVIAGAWIGQHWGLPGVALSVLVVLVIHFLSMAHLSLSLLPFTWRDFLTLHLPAIWLTVVVGAEVWAITTLLRDLNAPSLIILAANAIVLLLSVLLLFRFAPARLLGIDGIWFLRLLLERLPSDRLLRKKELKQSPESIT